MPVFFLLLQTQVTTTQAFCHPTAVKAPTALLHLIHRQMFNYKQGYMPAENEGLHSGEGFFGGGASRAHL